MKRFLQIQSQAYFQYLWYIVSGFLISPSAWAQTIPATLSWTGETRGIIFSSPVIDDNGIVYVGSNDNNLTAFNTDGSIKWTFTTGNWVDSSPALSKDGSIVYAGSWDNHLYAVNSDDGSLNWSFETNSYITSSPAVDLNGRVYFGSMDSIFYALESNGSLAWEYFVGQPVFSSPAIGENGTLYFGDENGTLHAVNPDGTVKWTYDIDDVVDTNKSILSSPAVDTSGNIYFGSGNGFCYSLSDDGDSVSLNWKYETGDRVDSSPVLGINDEVFFVSRDGYMRSLPIFSATNENLPNWEVFVGDVFYSTPVIDENGRVYVIGYTGDGENHLFAYDASGTKAWDSDVSPPPFEIPSVVDSSLLLSDDGNLYFGCFDKKLYCLDIGVGPADSDWPMFGRTSRRDSDWPSFNLSISANTGGVVTTSGMHYLGTAASISATPDTGYSFAGWTGDGVTDSTQLSTSVDMTQDRSVSASFTINSYDLSVVAGNGGSVSGSGSFTHGSSASISATPDTGYSFAGWTGDGVTDPDQASTFVIMKEDRNLTANFALRDVDKVLLSVSVLPTTGGTVMGADEYDNNANASIIAIPSSGYSFGGWTGDGITDPNHASTTVLMSEDRNISANFTINSYDLFISTETGGMIEGNGTFEYGSYANIFATPDTGYSFSRWTGSGVHDPLDFNTTVHMNEDRNIAALFVPDSKSLTFTSSQGGSVQAATVFDYGTLASILAVPDTEYFFAGWSGDGITDPNQASTTVLMSEDRNISANFTINSYDLFISTETGGMIEGNGTFEYGSYANIFATPNTGYFFAGWSGDGMEDRLEANTSVHMTEDRNISASFGINTYDLNILSETGGTASQSGSLEHGSFASIFASPDFGYEFAGWTGKEVINPMDANTTVYMTEDQNISALFSLKNYELNLLASSGGAINHSGSTTHGSYVSISAIPDNGYSFWGWTGDGITDSFLESTSVLMTSDRNVTAHFTINMISFLNPSKIEGSWYESWLGIFNQVSESWIYHLNLGWLLLKIEDSNLWIWHETNGWLWTTKDTFENRYIWSQPLGSWIFLQFKPLGTTLYYNYLTQSWVEW